MAATHDLPTTYTADMDAELARLVRELSPPLELAEKADAREAPRLAPRDVDELRGVLRRVMWRHLQPARRPSWTGEPFHVPHAVQDKGKEATVFAGLAADALRRFEATGKLPANRVYRTLLGMHAERVEMGQPTVMHVAEVAARADISESHARREAGQLAGVPEFKEPALPGWQIYHAPRTGEVAAVHEDDTVGIACALLGHHLWLRPDRRALATALVEAHLADAPLGVEDVKRVLAGTDDAAAERAMADLIGKLSSMRQADIVGDAAAGWRLQGLDGGPLAVTRGAAPNPLIVPPASPPASPGSSDSPDRTTTA